ncbi:MAG: hypothetical protein IJM72_03235, partial [Deltaproteobacteria bacterium]|nr:hypothetical protein [Deltaproteobacteria bacterium]
MAKSKTTTKKQNTKSTTKKSGKKSTKRSRGAAMPLSAPPEPARPIRRELTGLVFLALAAFMVISSFNADGIFIEKFSNLVKGMIGWGYWITAPAFLLIAFILFTHRGRPVAFRTVCAFLLPFLFAAIAEMLMNEQLIVKLTENFNLKVAIDELFKRGLEVRSAGVLGGLLACALYKAFSIYGALPILLIAFLAFLIIALRGSFSGALSQVKKPEFVPYDPSMYEEDELELEPVKTVSAAKKPATKIEQISRPKPVVDIPLGEDDDFLPITGPSATAMEEELPKAPKSSRAKVRTKKPEEEATAKVKPLSPTEAAKIAGIGTADDAGFKELELKKEKPLKPIAVSAEISDPPKKKISKEEVAAEAQAVADAVSAAQEGSDYVFPPLSLLRSSEVGTVDARDEIQLNRQRLENAIRSFGINASIVGVTHGPTVTRYDIELEQGVKLARVTNLAGDLALALGVVNVRIAPIPDKISTVGIEVPNKIVSTVYLRDILESPRFLNAKSRLSFALGKDIGGECIVGNISKLPHMLIAGTTGS